MKKTINNKLIMEMASEFAVADLKETNRSVIYFPPP